MTAPTLAEVRDRLVAVAKAGDTITYTDLYGDRYLAHARASGDLGEISLLEHLARRPLLSVVAVSKTTGQPSHGLFDLALLHDQGKTKCKCGVPLVEPGEDDPAFVARQMRLVRLMWTPPDPFGGPFRPLPGRGPVNPPLELRIDLDALEKGTQRHEATRTALADFIAANGGEPREPGKAAQFDLGWRDRDGTIWIAEVKSLARTSEAQQLRLGLGQVLDYRQAIATPEIPIRAALVIEQEPSDLRWVEVCAAVGVVLAWPERFAAVLIGIGRNSGSDSAH